MLFGGFVSCPSSDTADGHVSRFAEGLSGFAGNPQGTGQLMRPLKKEVRMRKPLIAALTAALMVGAIAMPAEAAKKKKKAPAPQTITFVEEGSLRAPAPTSLLLFGLTDAEFLIVNECASMPATQGHDAWVVEIPEEYFDGRATVEVKGADATGAYDLNLYFYDAGCALMELQLTEGADPAGSIPPGAKWAIATMPAGANATFTLTATTTVPAP